MRMYRCQQHNQAPDRPLHASFSRPLPPTSTFCLQQSWGLCTTIPAQYLRTSGVFCCWPDCLELSAWGHAGSGVFCGQFSYRQWLSFFIFAVQH